MNWYKVIKLSQGVQAVITENKKTGMKFLTLMGNTFAIKDELKKLGFRYFKGTWSTAIKFITPEKRQTLEALNLDMSILDSPQAQEDQPQQPIVQQPIAPTEPKSPVEQELEKMKLGIEQAKNEAESNKASAKVKAILNYVHNMVNKLATMVDEAAANDFVKSYLSFAAKFHNYSFGNQILIWIQNPKATKVAGAKQWMNKFGRQVVNWEKKIEIIAPRTGLTQEGKRTKAKLSPEQWQNLPDKNKYEYRFFIPVYVYDYADTEPIVGWKGPEGEGPYEPKEWRQDSNEALEEMTFLINAAWDWGVVEKGIDIKEEKMKEILGGYSAGQKIRINDTYDGINKFSTLIHELTHEVLHWFFGEDAKKMKLTKEEERKYLEIDAESTAFIVLSHYGFETKDTPRYIALWQGTGADVRKRREAISKAVKTIISGINKKASETDIED